MKADYCDITLVIDESGSMDVIRKDTIGGINRFIEDQRKQPGACTVSLVKFNHGHMPVYMGKAISEVQLLSDMTYQPGGSTALLDAVGFAIDEAGSRFSAMDEAQRPSKVIMVIVTDGQENASHQRTKAQIKEAIERQQTVYKWEFVFIGANIDAFSEAGGMNINLANTIQTHSTPQATAHVYRSLTANTSSFRVGSKKDMSWEPEQRTEQETLSTTK